jgi:hypothetical protein
MTPPSTKPEGSLRKVKKDTAVPLQAWTGP